MNTNAPRTSMLAIAASLALIGLGCSVDEKTCPRVAGEFVALYTPVTPVQASCDPLATVYKVPFDSGKRGVQETNVNLGYERIKTEIEATGCTLSMTQSVIKKTADSEQLEQKIKGGSLNVDAKDRVTGLVEMIRYDANQQVICSGMYDATFTQMAPTSSSTASSPTGS